LQHSSCSTVLPALFPSPSGRHLHDAGFEHRSAKQRG
jgi:hypothetical protein